MQVGRVSGAGQAGTGRGATKSVANLNKQLQRGGELTRSFGEQAGLTFRRFLAYTTTTRIFFQLAGAIREGFRAFVEFDRELIRIQQITRNTNAAMSKISKQVRGLAASLGVSSIALVRASRTLKQAGIAAGDISDLLPTLAATELAATFDDISSTTEGMIAVMNQFNLTGKESAEVLNSINAIAANFAVESRDLLNAFRRAGGAFIAASGDIDNATGSVREFLALFTSIRATTRETSESIATGLRTIFTRIQRSRTLDLLKQFNIELRNVEGNFVGPFEAVRRLNAAFGDIQGSTNKFRVVEEIGGFRQVSKLIPLITQFAKAQEALAVATLGTTSLQADQVIAQKSLEVQFTKLRESFNQAFAELTSSGTIRDALNGIIALTDKLIGLISVIEKIAPALAIAFAPAIIRGGLRLGAGFGRSVLGGGAQGLPAGSGRAARNRLIAGGQIAGPRLPGFGGGNLSARDRSRISRRGIIQRDPDTGRRTRGFGGQQSFGQRARGFAGRNTFGIGAAALIASPLITEAVAPTTDDASAAGIEGNRRNRLIQGTVQGVTGGAFAGGLAGGPLGAIAGGVGGGILAFSTTAQRISDDLEKAQIGEAIQNATDAFNTVGKRLQKILDPEERRKILGEISSATLEVAGRQTRRQTDRSINQELEQEFGFFENAGFVNVPDRQQRTDTAVRRGQIGALKDPSLQNVNRQTLQALVERGDISVEDLQGAKDTTKFGASGATVGGRSVQSLVSRLAGAQVDPGSSLKDQQSQFADAVNNIVESFIGIAQRAEAVANNFALVDQSLLKFNARGLVVADVLDRIGRARDVIGNLANPRQTGLSTLISEGDARLPTSNPAITNAQNFLGGFIGQQQIGTRDQSFLSLSPRSGPPQEEIAEARQSLSDAIEDLFVLRGLSPEEAGEGDTSAEKFTNAIVGRLEADLGPTVAPLFAAQVSDALVAMGDDVEKNLRNAIASGSLPGLLQTLITNPTQEFLESLASLLEDNTRFVQSTADRIATLRASAIRPEVGLRSAQNQISDLQVDRATKAGTPVRAGAPTALTGFNRARRNFQDRQAALRGQFNRGPGVGLEDAGVLGGQIRASRTREADIRTQQGLVATGQPLQAGGQALTGQAALDEQGRLAVELSTSQEKTKALTNSLQELTNVQGLVQAATKGITEAEKKRTDQAQKALGVLNQGFEQQAQIARGAQLLKQFRATGIISETGEFNQEKLQTALRTSPVGAVNAFQDVNAALAAAGGQNIGGFLGVQGELTGREAQTRFGAAIGGNLGQDQAARSDIDTLENARIAALEVAAEAFRTQQALTFEFADELGKQLLSNQDEFFNRLQGKLPTAAGQTPANKPPIDASAGFSQEALDKFANTTGELAASIALIPTSIALTMGPVSINFSGLEGLGDLSDAIRSNIAQDILQKLKDDPFFVNDVRKSLEAE